MPDEVQCWRWEHKCSFHSVTRAIKIETKGEFAHKKALEEVASSGAFMVPIHVDMDACEAETLPFTIYRGWL
jgi:hypothetical protein